VLLSIGNRSLEPRAAHVGLALLEATSGSLGEQRRREGLRARSPGDAARKREGEGAVPGVRASREQRVLRLGEQRSSVLRTSRSREGAPLRRTEAWILRDLVEDLDPLAQDAHAIGADASRRDSVTEERLGDDAGPSAIQDQAHPRIPV